MNSQDLHMTLYALFCLSRDHLPIDYQSIGLLSGITPTDASDVLHLLDQYSLADASRIRLTMKGLAIAVSRSSSIVGPTVEAALSRLYPSVTVDRKDPLDLSMIAKGNTEGLREPHQEVTDRL